MHRNPVRTERGTGNESNARDARMCPGLKPVMKFTKITKFCKSATKIAKIKKVTKFCKAIDEK